MLLAAPKTLQACFAALGDFYTWKLARYVYGRASTSTTAVLVLTIVSPWQWFTSTRTFSNSLETTLTIIGLYNWPWHWSSEVVPDPFTGKTQTVDLRTRDDGLPAQERVDGVTRLRKALLCAALATVLRPTNLLIWASLTYFAFVHHFIKLSPTWPERVIFLREVVLCGGTVLLLSTIVDRIFYQAWVFPPFNFLQVNVIQSLATFYGSNDWHYYISQGYPLLLTTALPFTLIGMYRSCKSSESRAYTPIARNTLYLLTIISLLVPAAFSNIAHKEVRFIYPLLPALHIISGQPLASFLEPLLRPLQTIGSTNASHAQQRSSTSLPKRLFLLLFLTINATIAYYTSQVHNSGIIETTSYLRQEFSSVSSSSTRNLTVGMLMPCHSTPWRSHIQHPATASKPGIKAWALTCEPPLNLNASAKASYLDEADIFYSDPTAWLKRHMSRDAPLVTRRDGSTGTAASFAPGLVADDYRSQKHLLNINTDSRLPNRDRDRDHDQNADRDHEWWTTRRGRRPWPSYLLFFAHLEPTLQSALRGSGYMECRRFFNSHWHDDWRRQGDVVVWCLDERRVSASSSASASASTSTSPSVIAHARDRVSVSTSTSTSTQTRLERVVEKPFWKVRDPIIP